MEPLKEMFNRAYFVSLAGNLKQVHKPFAAEKFIKQVVAPIDALSLNERMRHASNVLHEFLPADYETTIGILKDTTPLLKPGYTNLLFPDYVSQFGTHDVNASLGALHFFTRFGSSEFAIRTFLKNDFDPTLKKMIKWSEDENEHVRRLSSEGSRPRLPWSFKLDSVIKNPALTQPILHNLKQDESLYVRKSVANHLNDISKDSPTYVLSTVKSWDRQHPLTAWIIKRGCRSLLKQGDRQSLSAFSFTKDARVSINKFKLTPNKLRIGDALTFQFEIESQSAKKQKLMVDYRIHYVKKPGNTSPKVFKLKELELGAGASIFVSKKQRFQDFTTRKHYPGRHVFEILVNGVVLKTAVLLLCR